jgi:DNA-binding NarL/FixJ family response regulator
MADDAERGVRSPARTLVVDDHDIARLGLVAILQSIPGVRVVAEASDGPGAVFAVRTHDPDLVLMDVRMPDTEGLEAARQIRALRPYTRVVMISYWDVPEYRLEAIKAGATGYISKGAPRAEIVDEIDRVLRDEPPSGEKRMPAPVIDPANPASATAAAARVDRLAPRQREVLALIGLGLRNREIGERLGISTRTVQKTVERILKYLDVPNRTQAAMIWIMSGRRSTAMAAVAAPSASRSPAMTRRSRAPMTRPASSEGVTRRMTRRARPRGEDARPDEVA